LYIGNTNFLNKALRTRDRREDKREDGREDRREDGREDGIGEERCKGKRRRPFLEYVAGR
jgi:hypothetical protein